MNSVLIFVQKVRDGFGSFQFRLYWGIIFKEWKTVLLKHRPGRGAPGIDLIYRVELLVRITSWSADSVLNQGREPGLGFVAFNLRLYWGEIGSH